MLASFARCVLQQPFSHARLIFSQDDESYYDWLEANLVDSLRFRRDSFDRRVLSGYLYLINNCEVRFLCPLFAS